MEIYKQLYEKHLNREKEVNYIDQQLEKLKKKQRELEQKLDDKEKSWKEISNSLSERNDIGAMGSIGK